ncbi:MAG TPA: alpha/beta hydrolase [Rectinemataceae bacterium]|nr:alpha/beta hydrolase [Rectinemataceae bacterium]
MKRFRSSIILFLLLAVSGGPYTHAQSQNAAPARTSIIEGLWEGSIAIKQVSASGGQGPLGQTGAAADERQGGAGSLSSGLRLKILAKGRGALLDIPEQSMFGYPLDDVVWSESRIRFLFDALGPDEELTFEGFYSPSAGNAIIGTVKSTSWRGSFRLTRASSAAEAGEKSLSIVTEDGSIPGTLLVPDSNQQSPLVLLLAGAGTTDRNGNNYNVPGKSDCLAMLAKSLAAKGVATYRYDKRGSGEAYMLESWGATTSLNKHISDALQALRLLCGMDGFSRIVVSGMNEGAWTGAAAINLLAKEGLFVDGLLVLDSSGREPLDDLRASLDELDEATRAEAEAIVEAILAGKPFPPPSGGLADFFASSRVEWLGSWLKFSPAAEMARVKAPIIFVYGSADLQVPRAAFEKLLAARPEAAARVIPSMNYALKRVKTEEENYDSFTNPDYPLSEALVDLAAAFAKAKTAPEGSLPYATAEGD